VRRRLLLLSLPSLVAATAPSPLRAQEGAIEACVATGGRPRIVAAGQACRLGERRVSWSIQGPPGEPGPQGPAGAPGPAGEPGTAAKGPCDDKIGVVAFSGLPGQGSDAPTDLGFVKFGMTPADPAGGPRPVALTLYKRVDQNSPRLIMAAALLSPLTVVRFEVFRPTTQTPSLTVTLEDAVLVTGYRFASPSSEVVCEEIDVDFCQIEVTSIPEQGPPTTVRFNRCATP
jgi:hypothetical protein